MFNNICVAINDNVSQLQDVTSDAITLDLAYNMLLMRQWQLISATTCNLWNIDFGSWPQDVTKKQWLWISATQVTNNAVTMESRPQHLTNEAMTMDLGHNI